ncbi:hypothetical protein [Amycolatopsis sp. PS_44_ISF1]|nr:hypothetical protein [Amycolatopsis sp. PS_44_ISF1]MDT8916362.1 hypothetical protein [Amycolatopsis sp. PS_44_ISF1]
MASDGFRVYRQDPDDGSTDEVIRLGTSTNDYFAVVDTTGNLVASVDDTGQGNFTGLNVTGDAVIQGRSLSDLLGDVASASPGYFEGRLSADLGPIRSRVGVAEVSVRLRKGRRYQFNFRAGWKSSLSITESRWNLLRTHAPESDPETCPAPTITTPSEEVWWTTSPAGNTFLTFGGNAEFIAETTGRHRLLLTVERGGSTSDSDIYVLASQTINLVVTDLGPAGSGATGVFTQAGGTLYGGPPAPPSGAPVQQYYADLAPAGRATYRGNGSLRTDVSEVIQGMDPSGYNGDGRGQFWFNLPTITGTVDRVDVYLYSTHWYYSNGGTAILNISDQRGVGPSPYKFRGDWYVGGYPKPGGKTVTVPSDWFPFFRGTNNDNYNGRATVVTLGPGNGSNYAYYGKFSDCRLRIWYTQ